MKTIYAVNLTEEALIFRSEKQASPEEVRASLSEQALCSGSEPVTVRTFPEGTEQEVKVHENSLRDNKEVTRLDYDPLTHDC